MYIIEKADIWTEIFSEKKFGIYSEKVLRVVGIYATIFQILGYNSSVDHKINLVGDVQHF